MVALCRANVWVHCELHMCEHTLHCIYGSVVQRSMYSCHKNLSVRISTACAIKYTMSIIAGKLGPTMLHALWCLQDDPQWNWCCVIVSFDPTIYVSKCVLCVEGKFDIQKSNCRLTMYTGPTHFATLLFDHRTNHLYSDYMLLEQTVYSARLEHNIMPVTKTAIEHTEHKRINNASDCAHKTFLAIQHNSLRLEYDLQPARTE